MTVNERMCLKHQTPMYWDEWVKYWVCEECSWECDYCGLGEEPFIPKNPNALVQSNVYADSLTYDNDRFGIWQSTIFKKVPEIEAPFCLWPNKSMEKGAKWHIEYAGKW